MNETSEQNWDTLEVERTIDNDEFLYNLSREQAELCDSGAHLTDSERCNSIDHFADSLYDYMADMPFLPVSWANVNWEYIRGEILDELGIEE